MWKKGHKRKNWTERWFVLKPNVISYYVSEDLKDKRGDIALDGNCTVEVKLNKCLKNNTFLNDEYENNITYIYLIQPVG